MHQHELGIHMSPPWELTLVRSSWPWRQSQNNLENCSTIHSLPWSQNIRARRGPWSGPSRGDNSGTPPLLWPWNSWTPHKGSSQLQWLWLWATGPEMHRWPSFPRTGWDGFCVWPHAEDELGTQGSVVLGSRGSRCAGGGEGQTQVPVWEAGREPSSRPFLPCLSLRLNSAAGAGPRGH